MIINDTKGTWETFLKVYFLSMWEAIQVYLLEEYYKRERHFQRFYVTLFHNHYESISESVKVTVGKNALVT